MTPSTMSDSMNLSPFELARIVTNPRLLHHIADSFETDPLMTAILRHYAFLSDTIDELERNLERHRREQEFTFDILNNDQDFLARIEPMVKRFRRQSRTRHHPYRRSSSPPRTPSDNNSINPPITVLSLHILPETALARLPSSNTSSPVLSYCTAIDEIPGSKWNPIAVEDDEEHEVGSRQNPIVISSDETNDPPKTQDDIVCHRCKQTGHLRDDCDTKIRSFDVCHACKWKKQLVCDHWDPTPVWIRRQQRGLEEHQKHAALRRENPDGHD